MEVRSMAMDEAMRKRVRAGRLMLAAKNTRRSSQGGRGRAANRIHVESTARRRRHRGASRDGHGAAGAIGCGPTRRVARSAAAGPPSHGFGTELWTLKRVRALIERLYGVTFSEVHVWRLLGALGFSSQKPERRAIERNEDAVLTWKRKTWPALKKSAPPTDD
jgi:transposase